jgi:hypothetical protein
VLVRARLLEDPRRACCVAVPDVRLLGIGLVVDAELVEVSEVNLRRDLPLSAAERRRIVPSFRSCGTTLPFMTKSATAYSASMLQRSAADL